MEVKAIPDAEPVVHREHDEPATRQILIQRVGVRVIVRVVPAQQHLPRWTAVNIHDGGFASGPSRYFEQLSVDRQSVGRPKRSEERRVGKECRSRWSPY